jgi:hypothetical protein
VSFGRHLGGARDRLFMLVLHTKFPRLGGRIWG